MNSFSSNDMSIVSCAVVGCGAWGENLVRTLKDMKALKAIVDYRKDRSLFISQKYDIPASSFEEVLKEESIEAVFIATRPDTHFDLAYKALSHGKNVFVEKPLTKRKTEALDLFELARLNKKILMPGHLLLYHPCYQYMQKEIQKEVIGKILCITTRRQNFGKFFELDNVLWDLGPHDLSLILGLIPSEEMSNLSLIQGEFLVKDDIFTGTFFVKEGPKISLFLSRLSPIKEQSLTVIGEKGILYFEDAFVWDKKLQLIPFKNPFIENLSWPPAKGDAVFLQVPQGEPLKQECRAFFGAIQTGILPQEAHKVVQLIDILEKLNK